MHVRVPSAELTAFLPCPMRKEASAPGSVLVVIRARGGRREGSARSMFDVGLETYIKRYNIVKMLRRYTIFNICLCMCPVWVSPWRVRVLCTCLLGVRVAVFLAYMLRFTCIL